jgi:hypothetical protein
VLIFFAFLFEYKDLPIVSSAVLPPARSAPCSYPVAITQRRKDAEAERMGGTELPEKHTQFNSLGQTTPACVFAPLRLCLNAC